MAYDLTLLDVEEVCSFADLLLICSAKSARHSKAVAEAVEERLKKNGLRSSGVEGLPQALWVLMDYGSLIIHIFYEPIRDHYGLEKLWSDAGTVEIPPEWEEPGPGVTTNQAE